MTYRFAAGVILALVGALGLASFGYLLYGPGDHSRVLITLGMPGDLLVAAALVLMLLGGLGLMFEPKRRGAGR